MSDAAAQANIFLISREFDGCSQSHAKCGDGNCYTALDATRPATEQGSSCIITIVSLCRGQANNPKEGQSPLSLTRHLSFATP